MKRAALLVCLLAGACHSPSLGFAIALTIDASQLDDGTRALVSQLVIVGHSDVDHTATINLGRLLNDEERVVLRPPDGTTSIRLTVQAVDGGSAIVAVGDSDPLTMVAGKTTNATVPLLIPGAVDLGAVQDQGSAPPPDLLNFPHGAGTVHRYGLVIPGGANVAAFGDFDNPPDGLTDVVLANSANASVALYPSDPSGATYDVLYQYGLGNGLQPVGLAIGPLLSGGGTQILIYGDDPTTHARRIDLYEYGGHAFSPAAVDKGATIAASLSPSGVAVGRSDDPTVMVPLAFDDRVAVYDASTIHLGGTSVAGGFAENINATGYAGADCVAFGQLDPASPSSWSELAYAQGGTLHVIPDFTFYSYATSRDARYPYPGGAAVGLLIADLDGKNGNDVLVLTRAAVHVFLNQGAGELLDPVATTALGPKDAMLDSVGFDVGDFNHDGRLDLAVVDRASLQVVILYNTGTSTFTETETFSLGISGTLPVGGPLAIAFANLDGVGGRDDLIVPLQDGEIFALVNTTP